MIWPVMLPSTGERYPSGASVCRGYGSPSHPIHLCKVWWCAGNGLSRSSYWWHHASFWSYYVSGSAERGHFLCVLQQVSITRQGGVPNEAMGPNIEFYKVGFIRLKPKYKHLRFCPVCLLIMLYWHILFLKLLCWIFSLCKPIFYIILYIIFPNLNHKHIYFCIRDPDHIPGGELMLGGTDPNYYTGSFHYVSTKDKGKWEVIMKG